jgi:hypothetical protein
MSRRLIVVLSAAALTITALPAAASPATEVSSTAGAAFPPARFPLGERGAPTRTETAVAQGISLFHVRHGRSTDGWAVSVLMPNGRDHGTLDAAQTKAAEVEAAGFTPTVERMVRPGVADSPAEEIYMVRVGRWSLKQRAKCDKMVAEMKKLGIRAKADYLGDDGIPTTGPWDMRVLRVDPRSFRGSFRTSVGVNVAKRETVSSMARQAGAIAAVNGGFFNIHTAREFQGDPVGISVVGGRLLSEAVPGRSALVLKGRTARITEVKTIVTVASSGGSRAEVQGVNRAAEGDELVVYTSEWGAKTPANGGAEVVVDGNGTIVKSRTAGGIVPKGMWVLHGSGLAAEWIGQHAAEGMRLVVHNRVVDLRTDRTIPLTPDTYIMGGGVGLVRNGKVKVTAKADGHASVNMILRRHPRTMAGVTGSGGLILVTVDGRDPGGTVGASMVEAARLMRWLGAKQAINLDGGGSSTMVVKHKVVNRPSDGAERTVGDALLITPN